jgi:hypothetical protein
MKGEGQKGCFDFFRHNIFLNVDVVPGTLYLFSHFSYDTYIILPVDVLLLGILSS